MLHNGSTQNLSGNTLEVVPSQSGHGGWTQCTKNRTLVKNGRQMTENGSIFGKIEGVLR